MEFRGKDREIDREELRKREIDRDRKRGGMEIIHR